MRGNDLIESSESIWRYLAASFSHVHVGMNQVSNLLCAFSDVGAVVLADVFCAFNPHVGKHAKLFCGGRIFD